MDINFCLVVCNFNLKPLLYLLKFCRISSSLKVNQRKMSFVLSPAWLTSFWSTKACIHTFRHLTLIYLPEELRLVFIKRHFYRYKFSDTAYKQVITTNELIKKKKKYCLSADVSIPRVDIGMRKICSLFYLIVELTITYYIGTTDILWLASKTRFRNKNISSSFQPTF